MKRMKISLALVALLVGSIATFSFNVAHKAKIACVSGVVSDSSQCGNTTDPNCCITADGTNFHFPQL
jgi:hypothetical protein